MTSGTLVLKNNNGDDLTINANSTSFTFATALASGATYAVTVGTQPSRLACNVTNNTGTIASTNVTGVTITCIAPVITNTPTYTVGGTVSGLTSGTLVLKNNNGDDLTISANSTSFTFATALASGATYAVTAGTQPSRLACDITNNTGTIASANVTGVSITCSEGGGDSSTTVSLSTGKFIDSAVAGLSYTTTSQSGTTDANGSFQYKSGETVTFKLYGQQILATPGHSTLTPFDTSNTSLNVDYSINLIRFLMAIDTDSNPNNGITLPVFTGTLAINFNQNLYDFETNTSVINFLTTHANGRNLPSIQTAITHFMTSVKNSNDGYVFKFNGKAATSTMTNSWCTNNLVLGWQYTFGASSLTMVGDDTFYSNNNRICTGGSQATLKYAYSSVLSGDFLDCAPTCTYAQLNRIAFVARDDDGRTALVWTWHTPNSKVIMNIKRILVDPANPGQQAALTTFKEILTFD